MKIERLKNFTPHQITTLTAEGDSLTISSDGVARCQQTEKFVKNIVYTDYPIKVTKQTFGKVEGLPEPKKGVVLIVSRIVAAACPTRNDLVIPGPLVRDEDGKPSGCKGLSIL